MKNSPSKDVRALAVSPSPRGLAFAVMECKALVAWGSKTVTDGDKNARCLAKLQELIDHYQPGVLLLEDARTPASGRSKRIRNLLKRVLNAAKRRKLQVARASREALRDACFADGPGSKHALAEILAKRFPEHLAHLLPAKRRAWEPEGHHMPVFDAVALAVHYLNVEKAKQKT